MQQKCADADPKTTIQNPHASGNAPSNIVKPIEGKEQIICNEMCLNVNIFIFFFCSEPVHHPAASVSLVVSVPLPPNTSTPPSHHPNIKSFANSELSSVSFGRAFKY